jgi:hypothetical protein
VPIPDDARLSDYSPESGSDLHYVREAFDNQYNWILLGATAGFALLSASLLPLILGGGIELIYLSLVSQNERFRRLVRSRLTDRYRKQQNARLEALLAVLTTERRTRFGGIEKICGGIRENYRQLSLSSQVLTNQMEERLDGLRQAFLRLLIAGQQHGDYLKNFDAETIERALAQLQKTLDSGPEKIQAINHKRVEILNMRLEKLKRIRENLQLIDAQSSAIEDVLGLIRDQSITMRDPQSVSNQLGDLVRDVEQTEDSVREVESLFESPSPEEIQALPEAIGARADDAAKPPAGKVKA